MFYQGLSNINNTVKQVADAIATVLKVDVTIVDEQKRRIAVTGKNRSRVDKHIAIDSIFTKVLEEGNSVIITDTQNSQYCKGCSDKENCVELAHVCCPIFVDTKVVGLISLVAFSEKQRKLLQKDQDQYMNFIEKMASLLASKLVEAQSKEQLAVQKQQLEAIINSVSDGILALNREGIINYCNNNAETLLNKKSDQLIGKGIDTVFYGYNLHFENNTQTVLYKNKKNQFYMLVSCIPVSNEDDKVGAVLTLKTTRDIYEMASKVNPDNEISGFNKMIGKGRLIKDAISLASKAAQQDATILIQGESGTGKEIFARAIHQESPRRKNPFIAINCGAIPENLLESELFGYEEGAFTGTKTGGKPGKFELAHGGTIFLDEIGDMPLNLQVKLLRFLQDNRIEPLGSTKSKYVDVRIIAATNKELEKLMEQQKFREDLYYRLSVVPLEIPPLRERTEDVNLLIDYFLNKYSHLYERKALSLSVEAREFLIKYNWPGNVRELENCIEYAVNMVNGSYIDGDNLPRRIRKAYIGKKPVSENIQLMPFNQLEERLFNLAWEKYGEYKDAAQMIAEELQLSRATVYRKIKKYNLK